MVRTFETTKPFRGVNVLTINNSIPGTRYWGIALLCMGSLTLIYEIMTLTTSGRWPWVSFLDAIKVGARETLHITSGEWVYNPQSFLWLHDYLEWLPMTPTLLSLGVLGYYAPAIGKRASSSAAEFARMLVR